MIDVAKITVKSGNGGNGASTYRREKYAPKGGPDGGDGGDGGDVIINAAPTKRTLREFKGVPDFEAESGQKGAKRQKFGKDGSDLNISVPLGTVVWELDEETGDKKLVGEILKEDDKLVVAQGGLGGRGNVHFKSSANRTPLEYEVGGEGIQKTLILELKLLADVGLVGLPNAGKSTLLSVISEAKPKIADYPFTTLSPHLGVMEIDDQNVVVADIPGLIEKASQGKGLGHQFLRHIERCRVLVYLLSVPLENLNLELSQQIDLLYAQWQTLQQELEQHNQDLVKRPFMIVVNKQDILEPEFEQALSDKWPQDKKPMLISASSHYQLEEWKRRVVEMLDQAPTLIDKEQEEVEVFTLPDERRQPTLAYRPPLKKI